LDARVFEAIALLCDLCDLRDLCDKKLSPQRSRRTQRAASGRRYPGISE